MLLRPEALWFVVAIAAALWLLADRPHGPALIAAMLALVALLGPFTLYAASHFGSLVTPHISGNEALLSRGWLANRAMLVTTWFRPSSHHVDVWSVAPALALAFAPLPAAAARNGRRFLTMMAIVYCVFVLTNQAVRSQLPSHDAQDFEDATRGFIATTDDPSIPNPNTGGIGVSFESHESLTIR